MQFITVVAPEHVAELWDVPVDISVGLAGTDAYEKIGSSLQKVRMLELASVAFAFKPSAGGQGVFTQRRFDEGDVIMEASAVWMPDIQHVKVFLKLEAIPGQRFSNRIIKMTGLHKDRTYASLYGILVGLAGQNQHSGAGRRANAVLQVSPHRGVIIISVLAVFDV